MHFDTLKDLVREELKDASIHIADLPGRKDHLEVLVVSDRFLGIPLIEQHRIVMDIFKERLKTDIHALQIKTMTYDKARKRGVITEQEELGHE